MDDGKKEGENSHRKSRVLQLQPLMTPVGLKGPKEALHASQESQITRDSQDK